MTRRYVAGLVFGMVVASGCARYIDSYHSHQAVCDPGQLAKLDATIFKGGRMFWISRGIEPTFQVCVQTQTITGHDCISLGELREQLAATRRSN
jgi:hypothetical protein